jgi:hypothetical protein
MAAIQNLALEDVDAFAVEHIHLGSDDETAGHLQPGRTVTASIEVASAARGTSSRLDVLDGRFLRVWTRRARRPPTDYVVDLRFVDGPLLHGRAIPWRSLKCLAGAIVALLVTELVRRNFALPPIEGLLVPASVLLLTACFCLALYSVYRTRETLELRSLHGRARILVLEGGYGTGRSAAGFKRQLEASIASVRAEQAQPLGQFLRDEMREHHRLRADGVLGEADYEVAKARILRAHG